MTNQWLGPQGVVHKNFNLCPHCLRSGREAVLPRLCESIPMISRSDGQSFHLLLADRPLPYPLEEGSRGRVGWPESPKTSVCFWYTYGRGQEGTSSCVVILPQLFDTGTRLFREIERVADMLAEELAAFRPLDAMYELSQWSLVKVNY